MIKNLMLLHNWFKIYALSGSRQRGDVPEGSWSIRMNAPIPLMHIVKYLDTTKDNLLRIAVIRLVLSMLSVYKVLIVPVAPSLSSITDTFSGRTSMGAFLSFPSIFEALGIDVDSLRGEFKVLCEEHLFHETMAAGPNGHAVWAAHLDAYELANDPIVMENIRGLAKALKLKNVTHSLDNVLGIFSSVDTQSLEFSGGCHSKLHVLYEKGSKARIIAIGDYYSQSVLSPFHAILAKVLKRIPNDATFDQDAGFERIRLLSIKSDELNSLDLSKATDRLPREAQIRMMAHLLGNDTIAELWGKVLAERTFITETGHKVEYAVGQPMGFKSSFPAMALLHHSIVIQASINAGLKGFNDYVILGDDIVIASNIVAHEYRKLMDELGMEISGYKSVTPVAGTKCGAEFCSRLVVDGIEITGLPVNAIVEVINNGEGLVSL